MKKTIIISFLLLRIIVFSQSSTSPILKSENKDFDLFGWIKPDSILTSKTCVKVAPLSLLGIYVGPSIRMGIEQRIKKDWAIYNEFGYFFYNTKGAIAKLEIKNYLNNFHRSVGNYVSVELSYKYQEYETTDTISKIDYQTLQIIKFEKNYSVTKHAECLTIKYGWLTVYKYRIIVDAFIGIGARFKQGKNTLSVDENANIKSSSDYGPNVFTNTAGNYIYPNIDIGVKFGYKLR